MHLLAGWYEVIEQVLVQPPRFHHQTPYAVPVYATTEFLFWNRKPDLYWSFDHSGSGNEQIDESNGKNRKRFPGEEKRMNMLLSLEPLIYLESITNGR